MPSLRGMRRTTVLLGVIVFLLLVLGLRRDDVRSHIPSLYQRPLSPSERLKTMTEATREDISQMHLLLPVTSAPVSLCKTLFTAAVLGYPVPTLIGWNKTHSQADLVGGGRYVAKIAGILEWLDAQPTSSDDQIVMVVDAYGGFNYFDNRKAIESHIEGDVWFQLPVEVLLARYRAVLDRANGELSASMGRAYEGEGIKQSILFESSKRCTPNDVQSAACYPIPQSPLPSNLYGKHTDSTPPPDASAVEPAAPAATPGAEESGPTFANYRQRYLSSGYIMGPVGDMRAMFRRAHEKAASLRVPSSKDASLEMGSDQAIFHAILGEQEFQREVMRRRYGERARRSTKVGDVVVDDVLDPAFPHEVVEEKGGREDEFGISVDYFSDLNMQTTDNDDDGRWLAYNQPIEEQLLSRPRQRMSCTPHVSGVLPWEVLNSTSLPRAAVSDASQFSPFRGWDEISLYTNVCLDTIPVVVSHTGSEHERQRDWPEVWLQPHGRRLIEEILDRGEAGLEERGGAYGGVGERYYGWEELCPAELDKELYRDYYE